MTGICVDLANRNNPGADAQAWVDRQVAERADRTIGEVLDEWDAAAPIFEATIRKVPKAFGGLVYDLVAHEHDLAGALGRPGDRTSSGITASIGLMVPMVAADLARLGIAGTVRLGGGDHVWVVGDGEPTLSISTSEFELMRLIGSRRSRAQFLAAGWVGDVEAFLDGLVHLPLPEHDIVE